MAKRAHDPPPYAMSNPINIHSICDQAMVRKYPRVIFGYVWSWAVMLARLLRRSTNQCFFSWHGPELTSTCPPHMSPSTTTNVRRDTPANFELRTTPTEYRPSLFLLRTRLEEGTHEPHPSRASR